MEYEAGENITETDGRKIEEISVLQNYRKTLRWAKEKLRNDRELSLSNHNMLMHNLRWDSSVRPGDFRIKQVFIGEKGASIEQAIYIPPEHFLILEYMENWEDYLRNSLEEWLIKTAVIHAQFEIIHPFDDGNGRMLITLFLYLSGVLHRPMFYMSQYLENNRTRYYESLRNISQNNQW